MDKKYLTGFIAGMAAMALIGGGIYTVTQNSFSGGRLADRYNRIEEKLDLIDRTISSYYLDSENIDEAALEEGIYTGYVAGLGEDYSVYYTAEDFASVMESTSGSYSGIGAYVTQDMRTGIIRILKPFEEGPADRAGIQPGDVLYKVAGEEVTGEDINKVVANMKGEEGTTVDLTLYRETTEEYVELTVERALVDVPTVTYEMLEDQVGYIQISAFEKVTAGQFETAISDLISQGAEKLIFDLRDNGGGLMDSVCDILDVLLPKKMLVYTIDKNGERKEEWAEDEASVDLPMAVLVNENTASASEIFTGALKDYGAAEIIGTTTFGKGIVQSIVPLKDGSAVKMTSAKYYTPSGVCIHGVGIEPDQTVKPDPTGETDNQLQAAIDYLQAY